MTEQFRYTEEQAKEGYNFLLSFMNCPITDGDQFNQVQASFLYTRITNSLETLVKDGLGLNEPISLKDKNGNSISFHYRPDGTWVLASIRVGKQYERDIRTLRQIGMLDIANVNITGENDDQVLEASVFELPVIEFTDIPSRSNLNTQLNDHKSLEPNRLLERMDTGFTKETNAVHELSNSGILYEYIQNNTDAPDGLEIDPTVILNKLGITATLADGSKLIKGRGLIVIDAEDNAVVYDGKNLPKKVKATLVVNTGNGPHPTLLTREAGAKRGTNAQGRHNRGSKAAAAAAVARGLHVKIHSNYNGIDYVLVPDFLPINGMDTLVFRGETQDYSDISFTAVVTESSENSPDLRAAIIELRNNYLEMNPQYKYARGLKVAEDSIEPIVKTKISGLPAEIECLVGIVNDAKVFVDGLAVEPENKLTLLPWNFKNIRANTFNADHADQRLNQHAAALGRYFGEIKRGHNSDRLEGVENIPQAIGYALSRCTDSAIFKAIFSEMYQRTNEIERILTQKTAGKLPAEFDAKFPQPFLDSNHDLYKVKEAIRNAYYKVYGDKFAVQSMDQKANNTAYIPCKNYYHLLKWAGVGIRESGVDSYDMNSIPTLDIALATYAAANAGTKISNNKKDNTIQIVVSDSIDVLINGNRNPQLDLLQTLALAAEKAGYRINIDSQAGVFQPAFNISPNGTTINWITLNPESDSGLNIITLRKDGTISREEFRKYQNMVERQHTTQFTRRQFLILAGIAAALMLGGGGYQNWDKIQRFNYSSNTLRKLRGEIDKDGFRQELLDQTEVVKLIAGENGLDPRGYWISEINDIVEYNENTGDIQWGSSMDRYSRFLIPEKPYKNFDITDKRTYKFKAGNEHVYTQTPKDFGVPYLFKNKVKLTKGQRFAVPLQEKQRLIGIVENDKEVVITERPDGVTHIMAAENCELEYYVALRPAGDERRYAPPIYGNFTYTPVADESKLGGRELAIQSARKQKSLLEKAQVFLEGWKERWTYNGFEPPISEKTAEAAVAKYLDAKGTCYYSAFGSALGLRLSGVPTFVVSGFHNTDGRDSLTTAFSHSWILAYLGEDIDYKHIESYGPNVDPETAVRLGSITSGGSPVILQNQTIDIGKTEIVDISSLKTLPSVNNCGCQQSPVNNFHNLPQFP